MHQACQCASYDCDCYKPKSTVSSGAWEDWHDFIVCPYCGKEDHDDLHEYFSGNRSNTRIDCSRCQKEFTAQAEYTVQYCTSKVPCKDGEPHDFRFYYSWENKNRYQCQWCEKVEWREIENE